MHGLPGCMESAFMSGGHNDIHACLFTTQSSFHGRNNMHPDKSRIFNLILPTDRVTGGCEDYFKTLFHVRILFTNPDGRVYHDMRILDEFRRYHNVYSEYASFILD